MWFPPFRPSRWEGDLGVGNARRGASMRWACEGGFLVAAVGWEEWCGSLPSVPPGGRETWALGMRGAAPVCAGRVRADSWSLRWVGRSGVVPSLPSLPVEGDLGVGNARRGASMRWACEGGFLVAAGLGGVGVPPFRPSRWEGDLGVGNARRGASMRWACEGGFLVAAVGWEEWCGSLPSVPPGGRETWALGMRGAAPVCAGRVRADSWSLRWVGRSGVVPSLPSLPVGGRPGRWECAARCQYALGV